MLREAQLHVFLCERYVGSLSRPDPFRPHKVFFAYDDAYDGIPLSKSLPLAQQHFDEDASYTFFANLLPEDTILQEIIRQRRIAGSDLICCLAELGNETAGAIIVTADTVPPKDDHSYRSCLDEVVKLLDTDCGYLATTVKTRLSLAGAQDKLACIVTESDILVPTGYAPTTHILKPDSPIYKDLVFNEAFCLQLAKDIGLPAVNYKLIKINNKYLLSIERYDRYQRNNVIYRLHQEDFCQAMGIYPSAKYQRSGLYEGYYTIANIYKNSIYKNLTDFALFNFLIGNCDNHIKNISIIYNEDGTSKISPLYDTICTEVYSTLDTDLAIAIGRHYQKDLISQNDLKIFADDIGTTTTYINRRFAELTELIAERSQAVIDRFTEEYGKRDIFNNITKRITGNIKMAVKLITKQS